MIDLQTNKKTASSYTGSTLKAGPLDRSKQEQKNHLYIGGQKTWQDTLSTAQHLKR
jgi:hypothetical protein